ncbi:ethanolamine ammonia-lyase reactivating factor EutA [Halegenticoccus tardaugens]|uniref:ethanolamine ammonia-lyase reactivating factor EutA n=1 Tax=Halegenticoccus tardaugens TaxID=2071624 RepID=UPI00100C1A37|nr:ethanolamine ammonia-lyase reactivating factor EutA [Halegenticoccus tardaugens]
MAGTDPSTLTSVGIDIGTTTTQVVVSELTVKGSTIGDLGVEIVDTRIIYQGKIYETPLLDQQTLDVERISELVTLELSRAACPPDSIDSGAVIVTGESSYKENAETLVARIADDTGDFVVAVAGPELEAILAGKGAGAAARAAATGRPVLNVDIGGGTTNMCLFSGEDVVETRCLDVGGRLLRFDETGIVTHISEPAARLLDHTDITISVGSQPMDDQLSDLAAVMADAIVDTIGGCPLSPVTESVTIGSSDYVDSSVDEVMFSGGVGRLLAGFSERSDNSPFEFGDFGIVLATALRERIEGRPFRVRSSDEDIRATVIGAGTHATSFSGTTTDIDESLLPVKNLPVIEGPSIDAEQNVNAVTNQLVTCIDRETQIYDVADGMPFVLYLPKVSPLSYERLTTLAEALAQVYSQVLDNQACIVLTRQNCAKALGQRLETTCHPSISRVLIDEVVVSGGDYLDIGEPVGAGDAVPVVVKSLAFGENSSV